jgi:hypothetical protein
MHPEIPMGHPDSMATSLSRGYLVKLVSHIGDVVSTSEKLVEIMLP